MAKLGCQPLHTPSIVETPSNNEHVKTPHSTDSLVIEKDLVESFYKDEGGKANHLCAVVRLPQVSDESIFENGGLPIGVALHYDNGGLVEDADTFFTVLSFEPNVITSTTSRVELKFRLEKVSRRKDGRQFKVRFFVDSSQKPELKAARVNDVFTSSVTVYSKRKLLSRNSISSDSATAPPKSKKMSLNGRSLHGNFGSRHSFSKAKKENAMLCNRQVPVSRMENEVKQLNSRVCTAEKKMKEMFDLVQHQHERIRVLERLLKESKSMKASLNGQNPNQYFSPDHMLSLEDCVVVPSDPLAPLNSKRPMSDLQFNFGRSSSPLPQLFDLYE